MKLENFSSQCKNRKKEAALFTNRPIAPSPFLRVSVSLIFLLLALNISTPAQQAQLSAKQNPKIEKILSEISAANIEANIRKLVSFGTRHTLSVQDDPQRGIGAARTWIKAEFDRYSKESGGRLVVTEDDFIQPAGGRVPQPTRLINIVATLPGTQDESKERIYVVSGHYDSCVCTQSVLDATSDAPGANDDASGTAAVMEMARVMSKYEFDATIVFMTVPGEEQGLLGAAHWAELAKTKSLNIAAMFTNDIIGNTSGGNGVRDNRRVRLFSEGIPSTETEAEAKIRQSVGGENDGVSRQLARYIKETGERYVPNFEVNLIFRKDVDVDYDGTNVVHGVVLPGYAPTAGLRLGIGARTGGANDNHWIDDLQVTALPTDASSAEAGQTVHFNVSNDNPGLFSAQPAVSPNGTLTYTLAAGAIGSANVTVVAQDNGGTADGGRDTSQPCSFTISTGDTRPPTVTCPGNINGVPSTSPAGAVVIYSASGSDTCGLASLVCAPASGSTFPIGTTTVTCTATDGAGNRAACSFTVTVIPGSRPPTAVINSEQLIDLRPEYENPVLLSCNWWNACLVADGWTSSDPEGGNLTYLWFADQDPVPFGAGPVVTNCLEVGTHTIELIVTDPDNMTGRDSKIIEIVTAPLAIDLLIEQVDTSHKSGILLSRKVKRELVATLRVALAHAGREELRETQKALDAFEKKVRAQVARDYPEAATAWIRWSQAVSDGMEKCIKPPRKHKDDDKKDEDPKHPRK